MGENENFLPTIDQHFEFIVLDFVKMLFISCYLTFMLGMRHYS